MSSIIHDFPARGNHPLGLHGIISIAERWPSCWFVPLGGPSLRDGLRSFDKASAHSGNNPNEVGFWGEAEPLLQLFDDILDDGALLG